MSLHQPTHPPTHSHTRVQRYVPVYTLLCIKPYYTYSHWKHNLCAPPSLFSVGHTHLIASQHSQPLGSVLGLQYTLQGKTNGRGGATAARN